MYIVYIYTYIHVWALVKPFHHNKKIVLQKILIRISSGHPKMNFYRSLLFFPGPKKKNIIQHTRARIMCVVYKVYMIQTDTYRHMCYIRRTFNGLSRSACNPTGILPSLFFRFKPQINKIITNAEKINKINILDKNVVRQSTTQSMFLFDIILKKPVFLKYNLNNYHYWWL